MPGGQGRGRLRPSRRGGDQGRAQGQAVCMGLPGGGVPFFIPAAPEWGDHGWIRGNICPTSSQSENYGTFGGHAGQRSFHVHEQRGMWDQENLTPIWEPQGSQPKAEEDSGRWKETWPLGTS